MFVLQYSTARTYHNSIIPAWVRRTLPLCAPYYYHLHREACPLLQQVSCRVLSRPFDLHPHLLDETRLQLNSKCRLSPPSLPLPAAPYFPTPLVLHRLTFTSTTFPGRVAETISKERKRERTDREKNLTLPSCTSSFLHADLLLADQAGQVPLLLSQSLDGIARKHGSLVVATSCSTSSPSYSPSNFRRPCLPNTQPLAHCTTWPAGTTARQLCDFG